MFRLIALIVVVAALPVQAADREGPRQGERDVAYQAMARHPVTERYRYCVPTSAFSQRRRDEPRAPEELPLNGLRPSVGTKAQFSPRRSASRAKRPTSIRSRKR